MDGVDVVARPSVPFQLYSPSRWCIDWSWLSRLDVHNWWSYCFNCNIIQAVPASEQNGETLSSSRYSFWGMVNRRLRVSGKLTAVFHPYREHPLLYWDWESCSVRSLSLEWCHYSSYPLSNYWSGQLTQENLYRTNQSSGTTVLCRQFNWSSMSWSLKLRLYIISPCCWCNAFPQCQTTNSSS